MTQRAFAWFLDTVTSPSGKARESTPVRRTGAGFVAWLSRKARARDRARRRRATIQELQSLSDRQLRDIGVPRHVIPDVADSLLRREEDTEARRRQVAPGRGHEGEDDVPIGGCVTC